MAKSVRREQVLKDAWLGDAVLCLYARMRILNDGGGIDAAKCTRMTSNQFLGAVGEPSEVEAEIGRVYAAQGLEAAFAWIEQKLMPVFERQEARLTRLSPR
jgi:pyruvoyl-dependent arginine decarboxylase (PvlArgDC)